MTGAALLALWTLASAASLSATLPVAGAPGQRVAILVGANRPSPGRRPLLHAHRDAARLADTLIAVGRFQADAVHVLRDPEPDVLLATIEQAARSIAGGTDSLLYFYYSGHADDEAVYPAGHLLAMERLRGALEGTRAAVRIGMIDACRGGAWTRTKGLTAEAPFEVQLPVNPHSEGSVLIASSSGAESAHESDSLEGSFFTHHFVAALRGAGDRSGNGEVTLTEAFDHARTLTIRDTARLALEPQHPSYSMNLRGRSDLVLAHLDRSPSHLTVTQSDGPLDVIHLESGLALVELAPGRRHTRLAVPPGRYLVRKAGPRGNLAREVTVSSDRAARVDEADLVLVGFSRLSLKGDAPEPLPMFARSTLPGRNIALSLSLGLGLGWTGPVDFLPESHERQSTDASGQLEGYLQWALTDRLTWAIGTGAFAYRFGTPGGWEVVPQGGLIGWGFSSFEGFIAQLGAGVTVRRWLGQDKALNFELTGFAQRTRLRPLTDEPEAEATAGWSQTIANRVTFNLGLAFRYERTRGQQGFTSREGIPQAAVPPGERLWIGVGSVQIMALRTLPLVQVHLRDNLTIDLHARLRRQIDGTQWQYATLIGSSFAF